MRILALDTSTRWCSVAIRDGDTCHARDLDAGQTHSLHLLPMVAAVLADAGWTLADMDGIAFGAGPGSFTGVRIACGAAQGLAYGADLPVVAVPTLEAIAADAGRARVITCIDARMREVYVAAYARDADRWREVTPPVVLPPDAVARPAGADWAGAGNGFAAYPDLARRLGLMVVDPDARPAARAIAALALPRFAAGEGLAAEDALPLYVRHRVALTTAERAAGQTL